ncbi:hypothetical protein DL767_001229 [Monosporascus sp. MG133]|nr:hypothetical protein DL767_001229 [Monosporascus sp. MG133]
MRPLTSAGTPDRAPLSGTKPGLQRRIGTPKSSTGPYTSHNGLRSPAKKLTMTTRRYIAGILHLALLLHRAGGLPSSSSASAAPSSSTPPPPSLQDISIAELSALLDAGAVTSQELTALYLQRIAEVNGVLHAVIEVDALAALATAAQRDREREREPEGDGSRYGGGRRGPLHGIPILVKDNYATAVTGHGHRYYREGHDNDTAVFTGGATAAAGSVCLEGLRRRSGGADAEAAVVARLRDAGAVVLGKTNLNEFSGARGLRVPHGWSPRGGQTLGAYVAGQTACGSSSGSAVAASLGLAAGTLGTETAGSITCPAWTNNVVGIKPTVGLTSRHGIVPVTPRQDTAGPLARTGADAALLLDAIWGRDARDNWTLAQPWDWDDAEPRRRYTAALNASALAGRRLGVFWTDEDAFGAAYFANWGLVRQVFEAALADLEAAGAELVRVDLVPRGRSARELVGWLGGNMTVYAIPDGRDAMQEYLGGFVAEGPGGGSSVRNLGDLLRCVEADPRERAADFDYAYLAMAASSNVSAGAPEVWAAYAAASALGRGAVVDAMAEHGLNALVMFPDAAVILASAPGLPIVTVPMGALGAGAATRWDPTRTVVETAPGFPLGISFVADRWSEEALIGYAYAYEQVSRKRSSLKPYVQPVSDLDSILPRPQPAVN